MRATLFAHVLPKYNPYVALLQRAIQPHCDEPVSIQPRFTLDWAWRRAQTGRIAHIHWIEHHLNPQPWFGRDAAGYRRLIGKLGNNRISHPTRATCLLAQLALALTIARRAGARVVYTVHNLTAHHHLNGYSAGLEHLANRLIFAQADAVHVHSCAAAEAVARQYGRTHTVFVVPHGNYIGWYANQISRVEARHELGLPQGAFVCLFLGQIAPYKGLEDLIEAFKALEDASTQLVIAGQVVQAEYGVRIAALARHPRILYQPTFVPDPQLQVYLNAADVEVMPYQRITTSGSVLLALSFGCPVIAPALGGLPEVVPALGGVLYDSNEPGALQDALRRARGVVWSPAAILAYARQFDWSVIGAQMAQVYQAAQSSAKTISASQEAQA